MFITKPYRLKCLLLATLISLVSCQQTSEFTLLSGESKSLSDYKGQWVLVNFWAEWCPPCLKEIPELNALNKEGVVVLAVSYDKLTNQELAEQKHKFEMGYSMIGTDPMPYLPLERPTGLPANYLFTPDGEMIGPLLGTQTKESLLEIIHKVEGFKANQQ